jgi:rhamnosyltransferase
MGSPPVKHEIVAVVVLYHPSVDVLDNIDSYGSQVDRVMAVDNTEEPGRDFVDALAARAVDYLPMGGNKGIAAALNAGCRRARELGYDWVLTMDQDSTALPLLVERLAGCLEAADSGSIAIVAPVWQQVGGLRETPTEGCTELEVAMTSGNLLRLAAFESLGGFREDLFIDRVDKEFCLRARRHGWRIVQRQNAMLLHRMGALRRVTFPWHFYVTDYSPLRRYYMVRNLFELRREFGAAFPESVAVEKLYWRKEIFKVALAERQRWQKIKMMVRGWLDYRRGRFGNYDDLHSA